MTDGDGCGVVEETGMGSSAVDVLSAPTADVVVDVLVVDVDKVEDLDDVPPFRLVEAFGVGSTNVTVVADKPMSVECSLLGTLAGVLTDLAGDEYGSGIGSVVRLGLGLSFPSRNCRDAMAVVAVVKPVALTKHPPLREIKRSAVAEWVGLQCGDHF